MSDTTIGPRKIVKLVCDGCPKLRTENWRDFDENDQTDSGTSADCMAADRRLTAYWSKGYPTPDWCPHNQAAAPDDFARGIHAAANWVKKRGDDYDREHGMTDPTTGCREYPGNGDEYMHELLLIEEGIRAIAKMPEVPNGWRSAPDVADRNMLEEGELSLKRSLELFPDNLAQVVSNVYEDMLGAAPEATHA
ncbi:hypothetical protein [Nevskia sp.]|uniref:hypothetical protein n=1 Tax=Nevskia sp. TaxID=1929292 RepID=UPI003F72EFF6